MAGEAAAFCDPAWKVSDVTALSAVTQMPWVPPCVIRNPQTLQGTCQGLHRSRLTRTPEKAGRAWARKPAAARKVQARPVHSVSCCSSVFLCVPIVQESLGSLGV